MDCSSYYYPSTQYDAIDATKLESLSFLKNKGERETELKKELNIILK